jgi:cyclophilin family peptidyl-prolyl cis-trans isomerase
MCLFPASIRLPETQPHNQGIAVFQRLFMTAVTLSLAVGTLTADSPQVVLETSRGEIVIELDPAKAPKSVENFMAYVESDFYSGTVFHRVIPGFMIQCGGMTADLKKKDVNPPIENESGNGLSNAKYTVAMARTSDPNSATSQFYINTADNNSLDKNGAPDGVGYAVFGKVIQGTEIVDAIEAVQTTSVPNPEFPAMTMADVPSEPIVIKSAKILQAAQ